MNGKAGGGEKMTNYPDNDFYSPNYSTDSGISNTLLEHEPPKYFN